MTRRSMRVLYAAFFGGLALACAGKDKDAGETAGDTGESGETAASPVTLLIVMDNGTSMAGAAEQAGLHADALIAALNTAGQDYTIGVTTTSVSYADGGESPDVDPGEAGTLAAPLIPSGGAAAEALRTALLCHAACWSPTRLPYNTGYQCGDPTPDEVSVEYLDCLCGDQGWESHCGSGSEMGLEAAYLALCRAAGTPPADCYGDDFAAADEGSNAGLTTAGQVVHVLVISDAGDSSSRLATGDDGPGEYVGLYDAIAPGLVYSVFGPDYVDGEFPCNSGGAQSWSAQRYETAARVTGGIYEPLESLSGDTCAPADFSTLWGDWAGLIAP